MIVKRYYDDKLAQASYLLGCAMSGEALVVDANRDVEQYIRGAEAEGLRITHVTETHIHADYVSGSRELAQRTGATLYLSDEGGPEWKYAFAEEAGAVLVKGGDSFRVGNIRIDVVHTPGHTPEHISFLVTDGAVADRPMAILTGDFVFVGDVGRPDLLERAAKYEGTMVEGARTLFRSLQEFKNLPDYVQIWPGHGAGSACGKGIGAVPASTVGYERLFNWGLAIEDEDEFVDAVLAGQPEPPHYFAEMKRINRDGPPILAGFGRPPRLQADTLSKILQSDASVVDARPVADFAAGHLPGTINIPLNRSFNTWAGWLLPYDRGIYLIVDDHCDHCIDTAVRDLAMIGLDRVEGYFGAESLAAWVVSGGTLERVPQVTVEDLQNAKETRLLDVRGESEWRSGHIPGTPNIHVGYLTEHLDEIPRDVPLVLHCQGGGRSAIAASVLRARGFENVANLSGGIDAWKAEGLPVEKQEDETSIAGAASA